MLATSPLRREAWKQSPAAVRQAAIWIILETKARGDPGPSSKKLAICTTTSSQAAHPIRRNLTADAVKTLAHLAFQGVDSSLGAQKTNTTSIRFQFQEESTVYSGSSVV